MDIERETHDGKTILYIACSVCHHRVFMVDGFPLSGAEAEKELRAGFEAHVEDHETQKVRHR